MKKTKRCGKKCSKKESRQKKGKECKYECVVKKSKRKDKEDKGKREEERAGHTYQHLACLSSLRNGNERNTYWPHYIHAH